MNERNLNAALQEERFGESVFELKGVAIERADLAQNLDAL